MTPTKRTANDWLATEEFSGIRILDADGWRDGTPLNQPLTHDEFVHRLHQCTLETPTRTTGEEPSTSPAQTIDLIDRTLGDVSADPISDDAMRWTPAVANGLRALLIPADLAEPVRVTTLARDDDRILASAYAAIGCSLIEMLRPAPGVDFVFDEEGSPICKHDAVRNERANYLLRALKFAQYTGEYPAPPGALRRELGREAIVWHRQVHLFGTVLVIGGDDRTGDSHSVPQLFLDFAAHILSPHTNSDRRPLERLPRPEVAATRVGGAR